MKFSNTHKSKLVEGFSNLAEHQNHLTLLKTQIASLCPHNIRFSTSGMSLRFSQVPDDAQAAGLGLHLENTWTSIMDSHLPVTASNNGKCFGGSGF